MSKEIDKRVIDRSFHEGYEVDTVTIQESDYEYLKQRNKRYREAIEKAIQLNKWNNVEVEKELLEALESESE